MSEASKAVFLSYASQDAEAAKRIADALRGAGVEVWFDAEGGLEHGDEWDAKIRRQIKECVLFIPLISANTQAREEGYFRLEWDLAAERARTIASGVAFILPVLIDGTREPEALVPDRFRAVQWTKLSGGNVPPEVLQRFLKLWSHRTGALKPAPAQVSAASDLAAAPHKRWVSPGRVIGVTVLAFAVVAGAFFLFRSTPVKNPVRPPAVGDAAPETLSEARKLAQRARRVFDATTVVRQDMELAEQLAQKAEALDPTDAYVWAVGAQVDAGFVLFAYDSSETRAGEARAKAERAFKMAPESFEARLAKAFVLTYAQTSGMLISPEAGRLVEGLIKEQPTNRRVLLIQGMIMQSQGRWDEAARVYRLAHDRWAEGWALLFAGRLAEAETVAEEGFKAGQAAGDGVAGAGDVRQALMLLLSLNLRAREDLKATQAVIDRMPPDEMREEETACYAADLYLMQRRPEKVQEIVRGLPRDWLVPRGGEGPYKAVYSALAHQMANHPQAAEIEWRAALKLVEERLAARPDAPGLVLWKARLLARLGERGEAERLLQLYEQMQSRARGDVRFDDIDVYLVLGRLEEVLKSLPGLMKNRFDAFWNHAYLRFDPTYDPLRGDPRFAALLRQYLPESAKPIDEARPATLSPVISTPVDVHSVAVLAFADLSEKHDSEYFSDGVSEELLNVLAKVPGLRVAARTSAFFFKGKEVPIPEIAKQLGVAYVVEGSVRKQGDKVRITAQLIKADGGFHVWSDTFTRDLKDIFAVQDEIAGVIAKNLELKMGVVAARPTIDLEAYQEYLEGRALFAKSSNNDVKAAVGHFEKALAIEPKFTAAWVQLASAHTQLGRWGGTPTLQAWAAARAAIDHAVALEPDSPDVLLALGWILRTGEWNWRGAERAFRRALELRPNHPDTLSATAVLLFNMGRSEEALRLGRQAVELDPLNAATQIDLSLIFYFSEDFAAQEKLARRALQLAPTGDGYHGLLGYSLIEQRRFAEAEAEAGREKDEVTHASVLGVLAVKQHQPAVARACRQQLEDLYRRRGDTADLQLGIAVISAGLGDNDRAFAALEKIRSSRDAAVSWLRNDITLRPLYADPRWDGLIHQVGLADDQLK